MTEEELIEYHDDYRKLIEHEGIRDFERSLTDPKLKNYRLISAFYVHAGVNSKFVAIFEKKINE